MPKQTSQFPSWYYAPESRADKPVGSVFQTIDEVPDGWTTSPAGSPAPKSKAKGKGKAAKTLPPRAELIEFLVTEEVTFPDGASDEELFDMVQANGGGFDDGE
jgi:hypothetical protein